MQLPKDLPAVRTVRVAIGRWLERADKRLVQEAWSVVTELGRTPSDTASRRSR
jgi:hypothetical protein